MTVNSVQKEASQGSNISISDVQKITQPQNAGISRPAFFSLAFLGTAFILGLSQPPISFSSGGVRMSSLTPKHLAQEAQEVPKASSSDLFVGQGGAVGQDVVFDTGRDLVLAQENSFLAFYPPDVSASSGIVVQQKREEIIEYVVQPGETVSEIAEFFGVSVRTILWANDLSSYSIIKNGQTLLIPPVSGAIHTVKSGDTCASIAKFYKATEEEVVSFNNLEKNCELFVGEVLIIPGGVEPPPPPRAYTPTHFANTPSGFFVFPATGRISQGLHPVNAVDISNKCGTPILAATSGTVVDIGLTNSVLRYANRGYGNFVKILHEENIATLYWHLQDVFVKAGDFVERGGTIASMGGQPWTPGAGKSTGCHLHFEVRNAKNPFAR
jgi:murein DD-endopeptidase MepM/ murein hydrolase activator NlpD